MVVAVVAVIDVEVTVTVAAVAVAVVGQRLRHPFVRWVVILSSPL